MPWEEPLQQVLESVQGPVAKIVAVIIIIVTGLTLAFGETAGGFRRLIQIVFGLSIAFAASSASSCRFFSFGGGALIAMIGAGQHIDGLRGAAPPLARRADPARRRAARRSRSSTARSPPRSASASSNGSPGLVLWAVGHSLAVFAAKRDPDFAPVLVRHLRQKGHLAC